MSKNICNYEGCSRECYVDEMLLLESDKCIYHFNKDNYTESQVLEFWNHLRNNYDDFLMDEDLYIFEGVIFPKMDTRNSIVTSYDSEQNFFSNNKKVFEKTVIFKNCTFLGVMDFFEVTFEKSISFQGNNNFTDDLKFNNAVFNKSLYFNDQTIESKLVFRNTTFNEKVELKRSTILDDISFEHAKFNKTVDFYESKFYGDVNFGKTDFNGVSVFTKAEFFNDINFKYSTFNRIAIFRDGIFRKSLDLRDSIFNADGNFLNLNVSSLNRETARIIKNSFEQQNNNIEANRFYALEMEEREKELIKEVKNGKNYFEWLVFKIHGLTSNHSQDWLLALFWIIIFGYIASLSEFFLLKDKTEYVHFTFLTVFKTIFLISLSIVIDNILKCNVRVIRGVYYIVIGYLIYYYITKDVLLSFFSKTINPFSIMRGDAEINLVTLTFKIIIGYLIYQLIISVRQNTRRK